MWLPKRERNLLAAYASIVEINSKACEVSDNEIVNSLGLKDLRELYVLKTRLKRRDLLAFSTLDNSKKDSSNPKSSETGDCNNPSTFLTEQGLLIGQKYCTNIGTFELWSRANLWFWFFVVILLCIIALFVTLFLPW